MSHESSIVVVASENAERAGTSHNECVTRNDVDTTRPRIDLVCEVTSPGNAGHSVLLEEPGDRGVRRTDKPDAMIDFDFVIIR